MPPTVRRKIIYQGRVQGVGFRAAVLSVASKFDVNGFVRNLPDGTVELVAEGSVSDVEGLLTAIGDRMSRYITDAAVADVHEGEPLDGFAIR
ncbi:MAG: acylphosphatase [Planctomycetaceae bacterium]